MIEPQSLRGAALYNPHLHGKQELASLFVVRRELLEALLDDLRATASGKTPQHHLILGQRGMGKTMLLRRLAFAIEDDPVLGPGWLALTFPEEQYNVSRLSDFWLNCTDALSDLLESQGRHEEAERLDASAEALRSLAEEVRTKKALTLLVETARRIERRLVLLVDNVDLVLDRVGDQEWTLREVLSAEPNLVLVGASANAVESSFVYDEAFYDFFRVHELGGLSLDETRQLLVQYADVWDAPEVRRLAEQESARIKVLHNLTGGNPRTIVLLFNVLAAGVDGDVRSDLERLLDQCTPLYKARFEALPPQAQQVVHALAVHWDPISAGELTEHLGMDVNAVSSQLARLVKQGVVEKVAYDPESKTGFQIAERFFNIWYLMRASRRVRRRLLWLVEFLRMFYSQEQLEAKALLHIQLGFALDTSTRLRRAEYGFALADAIRDETWRSSLERSGVYALAGDAVLQSQLSELVDFEEGEGGLEEMAGWLVRLERARASVITACLGLAAGSGEELWAMLKDSLALPLAAKVKLAEELPGMDGERREAWKATLASERERLDLQLACASTAAALATAARTGIMADLGDFEGAARAESVLGVPGLAAVALAHRLELSSDDRLLPSLEQRLESTTSPYPWLAWLRCLPRREAPPPAQLKRAIDRTIELGGSNPGVLDDLGRALGTIGSLAETEAVLRRTVALDGANASAWLLLGLALVALGRVGEGVAAFEKARDIRPDDMAAWFVSGLVLVGAGRLEEAEEALRKVIDLDPAHAPSWSLLERVLARSERGEEAARAGRHALDARDSTESWRLVGEVARALDDLPWAEEAFRRAVACDAANAPAWIGLGSVSAARGRFDEAESAYRTALERQPSGLLARESLAWFLVEHAGYAEAAELADGLVGVTYRGAAIQAAALAHQGKWDEAAPRARAFFIQAKWDQAGDWKHILPFLRAAVSSGRAREALEILEEAGGAERWRPLAEALRAAVPGGEMHLRRVAAEVRGPARQILAQLLEPVRGARKAAVTAGETSSRKRKPRPRKGRRRHPAGTYGH